MNPLTSEKGLRVLSISDIHLGATHTPTRHIVRNLRTALPDSAESGGVDLLLIGGDVFDRLLQLGDENVFVIKKWIFSLLWMCKRRDIIVRVLEGTPSHDRKQSQLFTVINESGKIGVDLRYVSQLEIEYIEPLGIHVLYIPDEWKHDTDETWKDVGSLMQQKQLEKVDITLLHGSLDFQLPEFVKSPKHVTERYRAISRLAVFAGHVHHPSQNGRVFANGSFDRLGHGEEEAKGFWDVTFRGDDFTATFVENRGAMRFDTIDVTDWDMDFALSEFRQMGLEEVCHIRLLAPLGHPLLSSLDVLRKVYPNVRWTTKVKETDVQSPVKTLIDLRATYRPVELTRENIVGLLLARLGSLPEAIQKRSEALLRQLVESGD